jgi:hypothetical protein
MTTVRDNDAAVMLSDRGCQSFDEIKISVRLCSPVQNAVKESWRLRLRGVS